MIVLFDNTEKVVKNILDKRLKYIKLDRNSGLVLLGMLELMLQEEAILLFKIVTMSGMKINVGNTNKQN